MIVPEAANMPLTPWQTEILAGGGGAAHLAHALLQGVHAVHAGVHVRQPLALERQLASLPRWRCCARR
jgi:hypothetical protein